MLRGGSTDLMILDEFQMMSEEGFRRHKSPPRLADRDGDCLFYLHALPPSKRMRAKTMARDPLYCAKLFKRFKDDPRWLCMIFGHVARQSEHLRSWPAELAPSADLTVLSDIGAKRSWPKISMKFQRALWTPAMIEADRVEEIPKEALPLARVVVGLDPSGSSTNEAGIICAA